MFWNPLYQHAHLPSAEGFYPLEVKGAPSVHTGSSRSCQN
jgi:hypothetical protein